MPYLSVYIFVTEIMAFRKDDRIVIEVLESLSRTIDTHWLCSASDQILQQTDPTRCGDRKVGIMLGIVRPRMVISRMDNICTADELVLIQDEAPSTYCQVWEFTAVHLQSRIHDVNDLCQQLTEESL